jgi:hypothetical protein
MTWLYLQALGSLFVSSYDLQGHDGGILPRLHTGSLVRQKIDYLHSRKADHIEETTSNSSSIVAYIRSLAMVLLLLRVYVTVA